MKKSLLVFALFSGAVAFGQNLVPNPGFEVQDSCPEVSEIELAQPWNSPTLGTPDLFNSTCPTQNGNGRTGIGSSGVYTRSVFPDNREYIQAELTSPLVAGQSYCISFYVARVNLRYGCNQIGAHVKSGETDLNQTSVLNLAPQVAHNPSTMLGSSWTNVFGTFTATGGEDHILIGNFADDADTDTIVANPGSSSKSCYYRIDDISLIACAAGLDENVLDNQVTLFPNPASGEVSVQITNMPDITSVAIVDAIGKEVLRIDAPQYMGEYIPLDIAGLPDGAYIVRIVSGDQSANKRLVVRN